MVAGPVGALASEAETVLRRECDDPSPGHAVEEARDGSGATPCDALRRCTRLRRDERQVLRCQCSHACSCLAFCVIAAPLCDQTLSWVIEEAVP